MSFSTDVETFTDTMGSFYEYVDPEVKEKFCGPSVEEEREDEVTEDDLRANQLQIEQEETRRALGKFDANDNETGETRERKKN